MASALIGIAAVTIIKRRKQILFALAKQHPNKESPRKDELELDNLAMIQTKDIDIQVNLSFILDLIKYCLNWTDFDYLRFRNELAEVLLEMYISDYTLEQPKWH